MAFCSSVFTSFINRHMSGVHLHTPGTILLFCCCCCEHSTRYSFTIHLSDNLRWRYEAFFRRGAETNWVVSIGEHFDIDLMAVGTLNNYLANGQKTINFVSTIDVTGLGNRWSKKVFYPPHNISVTCKCDLYGVLYRNN